MEKPIRLSLMYHRHPWSLRGLIAAIAVLPVIAYLNWTPASWWTRSGFLAYPGTFIRLADNHYRLCRPWPKLGVNSNPLIRSAGRTGRIVGRADANFAVLLPRTARIVAIYCGAAAAPLAPTECTNTHCSVAVRAMIDDSIYTKGRGVTFNVRALDAGPGQRTDVGFWVAWNNG